MESFFCQSYKSQRHTQTENEQNAIIEMFDTEGRWKVFNLELKLQRVDLYDARVSLLIDEVHLCLQDPPLALGITETV